MSVLAAQSLLFEIPATPKKERSKWEELAEMAKTQEEVGGFIPPITASVLLDVSRSRIGQLVQEGTFRSWVFFGQRYLSAEDVRAFVAVERKAGRPWKEPSAKEIWKRSRAVVRGEK